MTTAGIKLHDWRTPAQHGPVGSYHPGVDGVGLGVSYQPFCDRLQEQVRARDEPFHGDRVLDLRLEKLVRLLAGEQPVVVLAKARADALLKSTRVVGLEQGSGEVTDPLPVGTLGPDGIRRQIQRTAATSRAQPTRSADRS